MARTREGEHYLDGNHPRPVRMSEGTIVMKYRRGEKLSVREREREQHLDEDSPRREGVRESIILWNTSAARTCEREHHLDV